MAEQILKEVRANRYRFFGNADGGKLIITDQRVRFEPHTVNINTEPEEIPFTDIASVSTFGAAGIIPWGVRITTHDGSEYKYVIWWRGRVIKLIKQHM